jgi:hypothetical protein
MIDKLRLSTTSPLDPSIADIGADVVFRRFGHERKSLLLGPLERLPNAHQAAERLERPTSSAN